MPEKKINAEEAMDDRDRSDREARHQADRYWGHAGSVSNARITARNGGVRHQFIDDIGGCSANYQ